MSIATKPDLNVMSQNDAKPQLMASNANHQDQPYSSKMQVLVVGVHGTANEPSNVAEVTRRIGESIEKITSGNTVTTDTSFSWKVDSGFVGRDLNWEGNQEWDRKKAAGMLTDHVLGLVDEGIRNGTIDRTKPLIITPVGFSHGGNVALQAAGDISEGLKQRGINGGIHLVTLSTPAYNNHGAESTSRVSDQVRADGITFEHTHFHPRRDVVAAMALGNGEYINGKSGNTRNYELAGNSFLNGVGNHGNTQDSPTHIKIIQAKVQEHFHNLAYGYGTKRAELDDGNVVASSMRNGINDGTPLQVDKKQLQAATATTSSPTLIDNIASKPPSVDASLVSKSNDTVYKNDIYKNDGAPLQVDKQQLQGATATTPSLTLVEGNDAINKLLKQAMSGVENTNIPNKLDAAALAVQTISQSPAFKQNEPISVMEGTKGLIVSQGQGPAGVNLLVPPAEAGDFNKVSEQMTRSQPQQNMQLAQTLPDPEMTQKAVRSM